MSKIEQEKDLLSRLSLKEGNQRLEKPKKIEAEITYPEPPMGPNVQSPVIFDNLDEEQHPIHNIKSNFQFASGNKFDMNMNKITLVKNPKRDGDINEVVGEGTSSGSRIGVSPRQIEANKSGPTLVKEEEKVSVSETKYRNSSTFHQQGIISSVKRIYPIMILMTLVMRLQI